MRENRSGADLAERLLLHIKDTEVEDVYLDEDENGENYLGVVFTNGETEYHLTFQEDGTVELALGPLEGENLETVVIYNLSEAEPPFSEEGLAED